MSTAMHRILVKKLHETCEVQLTIDFWSNRQMRSYIGVTVHFISFQIKSYTMHMLASRQSQPAVRRNSQQF